MEQDSRFGKDYRSRPRTAALPGFHPAAKRRPCGADMCRFADHDRLRTHPVTSVGVWPVGVWPVGVWPVGVALSVGRLTIGSPGRLPTSSTYMKHPPLRVPHAAEQAHPDRCPSCSSTLPGPFVALIQMPRAAPVAIFVADHITGRSQSWTCGVARNKTVLRVHSGLHHHSASPDGSSVDGQVTLTSKADPGQV